LDRSTIRTINIYLYVLKICAHSVRPDFLKIDHTPPKIVQNVAQCVFRQGFRKNSKRGLFLKYYAKFYTVVQGITYIFHQLS
jgi:hypothetical protein